MLLRLLSCSPMRRLLLIYICGCMVLADGAEFGCGGSDWIAIHLSDSNEATGNERTIAPASGGALGLKAGFLSFCVCVFVYVCVKIVVVKAGKRAAVAAFSLLRAQNTDACTHRIVGLTPFIKPCTLTCLFIRSLVLFLIFRRREHHVEQLWFKRVVDEGRVRFALDRNRG